MTRISTRAYYVVSALIMVAGSVVMFNGGRQHPQISDAMGPLGSPTFFKHFAEMMVSIPNWRGIHAQILSGPVLWAIGGLAFAAWLRTRGERYWSTTGIVVSTMGAVLWVITYLWDGFVSPMIAPNLLNVLNSKSPLTPSFIMMFGASQEGTIRMAVFAWFLIAFGTMFTSISMLVTFRARVGVVERGLTLLLGTAGVIFGIWPVIAWVTGTFYPGPMISPWYIATASGMQIWWVLNGLWLLVRQFRRGAQPATVTDGDFVPKDTRTGPVKLAS